MTDLPRPNVTVVHTEDGKDHLAISRPNSGRVRTYEIEGVSPNEKIRRTVEKVIGDHYTGEWLP